MVLQKIFPGHTARIRTASATSSTFDKSSGNGRPRRSGSEDTAFSSVPREDVPRVFGTFEPADDVSSIRVCDSVNNPPPDLVADSAVQSTSELNLIFPTSNHTMSDERKTRSSSSGKDSHTFNMATKTPPSMVAMGGETTAEGGLGTYQSIDNSTICQKTSEGIEVFSAIGGLSTFASKSSIFSISLLSGKVGLHTRSTTFVEKIVKSSLQRNLRLSLGAPGKIEAKPATKIRVLPLDKRTLQKWGPQAIDTLAQKRIKESRCDEAVQLYKLLLEIQRKEPHGVSLDTFAGLSLLHLLLGRFNTSLKYAKQALNTSREESKHTESAIALMMIGLVYFGGNALDKALRTWREALQLGCLVFGYDHPYVAVLLNNLGCLHYQKGDFGKSLKTFSESLDLNRKFLGSSVGSTKSTLLNIAFTKSNIAVITAKNGDLEPAVSLLEEALSLQESAVEGSEKFLMEITVESIERLTGRREPPGKLTTPVRRHVQCTTSTSVASRTNGTSEAAAVQSCDTFQVVSIEEGQVSIFGDSDGIPMRRAGGKSPLDGIDSSDNLDVLLFGSVATEYTTRQRVRAAILCYFGKTLQDDEDRKLPFVPFAGTPRKRMRIPVDLDQNAVIDAELHLHSINEQAADHLEHEEIDEALELFKSVLRSHLEKYGNRHHLVGTTNHNIGLIQLYAQDYMRAIKSFEKAVATLSSSLGSYHPSVSASMMKIGMTYLLLRDPDKAKEIFFRILKLTRQGLGCENIQVARVLNNIAIAQYGQGAYLDSFRTLQEAHTIQRNLLHLSISETYVLSHAKTIELALANTLSNIGFLYCKRRKYDDATKVLEEAMKFQRKHDGIFQSDLRCIEENLRYVRAMTDDEKNDPSEAIYQLESKRGSTTEMFNRIHSKLRC